MCFEDGVVGRTDSVLTPEAVRDLLAKATPPPWKLRGDFIEDLAGFTIATVIATRRENAPLIVAAVNALPGLLDEGAQMAALRAERDALRSLAWAAEAYDRWSQVGTLEEDREARAILAYAAKCYREWRDGQRAASPEPSSATPSNDAGAGVAREDG